MRRVSLFALATMLALAGTASAAENVVTKVTARADGGKTIIVVHGSATPSFTAYRLERPARGDWTWTLHAPSGERRHSTFLGSADGLIRLSRLAPDHRPGLSRRGENALRALALMHDGHTNTEIAQILATSNPGFFASVDEALELARAMALRHGR